MKKYSAISLTALLSVIPFLSYAWGFFAHERINRLAVFSLPPEMAVFYKYHSQFLKENAVNPDRRRYAVAGEAPRHYIDLDVYGDSALHQLPKHWKDAVAKYSEDTLMAYGIVPWHIYFMKHQLTEAFRQKDVKRILRVSADLGHYIADANVPLHTTQNYNGQLTGQHGIHGFWESRLPELYSDEYDFFVGPAHYIDDPQEAAWLAVTRAHHALDSVLRFEKELSERFSADKKYSFEQRGGTTIRVYAKSFSKAYHAMLMGQVERQMRASVKMVADFWYTSWIDAGQPDLSQLLHERFTEDELKELEEEKRDWEKRHRLVRPHDSAFNTTYSPYEHLCCAHPHSTLQLTSPPKAWATELIAKRLRKHMNSSR